MGISRSHISLVGKEMGNENPSEEILAVLNKSNSPKNLRRCFYILFPFSLKSQFKTCCTQTHTKQPLELELTIVSVSSHTRHYK